MVHLAISAPAYDVFGRNVGTKQQFHLWHLIGLAVGREAREDQVPDAEAPHAQNGADLFQWCQAIFFYSPASRAQTIEDCLVLRRNGYKWYPAYCDRLLQGI